MKALVELTRDLCWLRRGPQDLPFSPRLSLLLFALACLADALLAGVVMQESDVLPRVLVGNALMVGLPWVALNIAGLNARFVQVAGALSMVSIAFAFLIFPILLLNAFDTSPKDSITRVLAALVYLALLGWYVVIEGHVLRHALKLPLVVGIAIAVIFELVNLQVRVAWFGDPSAQAEKPVAPTEKSTTK
jgi:hypothetical protein